MRFDDEISSDDNFHQSHPIRCIALALALTYYFRLPSQDNTQGETANASSREELAALLSKTIPAFADTIDNELSRFVNPNNFLIPNGVAINQAVCVS